MKIIVCTFLCLVFLFSCTNKKNTGTEIITENENPVISVEETKDSNVEIINETRIFRDIINENYYIQTIEFNSNILYRDGIEIYKIFSNNSLNSLRDEFDVIKGEFYYIGTEYYNRAINKYQIIILQSKEELQDMRNKIIRFNEVEQNIDNNIFESYMLGLIVVSFSGSNYLMNAEIYSEENDIEFSIDIWGRITPPGAAPVAAAWQALFFLKIPK